ncbi:MAG: hypothetical protein ABW073_02955 [Acidimicrobiia bacterium]
MDKVKETAQKGADAAKGAVNAGQEKIDDLKTEKKIKELKEQLGGLVYAQQTGSPADDHDAEVARIVGEIRVAEAESATTSAEE